MTLPIVCRFRETILVDVLKGLRDSAAVNVCYLCSLFLHIVHFRFLVIVPQIWRYQQSFVDFVADRWFTDRTSIVVLMCHLADQYTINASHS